MATLTMRYTTKKKYDALSDEDKSALGYIYYVKASNGVNNSNAYYSNNRCYGAVPLEGEVAGLQEIADESELPAVGRPNTIYAYYNSRDELTLYYWDSANLHYHRMEETYDVIDGGDAISKAYVVYNK